MTWGVGLIVSMELRGELSWVMFSMALGARLGSHWKTDGYWLWKREEPTGRDMGRQTFRGRTESWMLLWTYTALTWEELQILASQPRSLVSLLLWALSAGSSEALSCYDTR